MPGSLLFKIIKSYKGFSSFDLVTTFTSIATVAAIAGPLAYRSVQSDRIERARADIVKIASATLSANSTRSIASVEGIGGSAEQILDPWKHPYQKETLKNAYGQPSHLVVWSNGPNGKFDSEKIKAIKSNGLLVVEFQGDDVGYVVQLK